MADVVGPVPVTHHPACRLHDPGAGHPKRPGRMNAVLTPLRRPGTAGQVRWHGGRPATGEAHGRAKPPLCPSPSGPPPPAVPLFRDPHERHAIAIASISTRASFTRREHSNVVRAGGSTGKYWLKISFIASTSPRSTM